MKKTNKRLSVVKKQTQKPKSKRATGSVPLASTGSRVRSSTFSFRLRHREFIASLDTATSYTYDLAVTDAATFPWLSNIAPYFDQWRLWSLRFGLTTTLAATTGGTVAMAYDPNCTDTPAGTLDGLLQMAMKDNGPVWQSLSFQVPKVHLDRSPGPVRFSNVSTASDPHLRSIGQVLINSATTSTLTGAFQLFVEYDVELINPQPVYATVALPEDLFPDIQINARNNGQATSASQGNLLSIAQAAYLEQQLPPSLVNFFSHETSTPDRLFSGGMVPSMTPIEFSFREAGEYAVELSNLLWGGMNSSTTFPLLANWTSGITDVKVDSTGLTTSVYDRTFGAGSDWYNRATRLFFKVLDSGPGETWGAQPMGSFSSSPKYPTIALGAWDTFQSAFQSTPFAAVASTLLKDTLFKVTKSPRRRLETIPVFLGLVHETPAALMASLKSRSQTCSGCTTTTTCTCAERKHLVDGSIPTVSSASSSL
jgi:hypothetical protein